MTSDARRARDPQGRAASRFVFAASPARARGLARAPIGGPLPRLSRRRDGTPDSSRASGAIHSRMIGSTPAATTVGHPVHGLRRLAGDPLRLLKLSKK